jgi:hypothetical protein
MQYVSKLIDENPEIFEQTRLNKTEILRLIELCLHASSFQYNQRVYKQIKGTPMGSPVSVVIAEIVVQALEEEILSNNNNFQFWYHYVDDIISSIPRGDTDHILENLNSVNRDIQFTLEKEEHNTINFLDLKIVRKPNNSLAFTVHRKPTHTNKYLNYESCNPRNHKESVVRSLLTRADKICDDEFKMEENKMIEEALQMNNYPRPLINKVKRKLERPNRDPANDQEQNDRPRRYVSAPYMQGISEKTAKILRPYNIQLSSKATKTIKSQLCHLKDRREQQEQADVVYKLECKDCDVCYVGETGRQLKERRAEHQKDVEKKSALSNVYQHTRHSGHAFDFDGMKVLDNEKCKRKRKVLESVYTIKNHETINRSMDLDLIYHPFLRN